MKLDAQQRMNFTLSGLGSFVLGFPETGELHGTGNSGWWWKARVEEWPCHEHATTSKSQDVLCSAGSGSRAARRCLQNAKPAGGHRSFPPPPQRDLFASLCAQKTRHEADYSHENLPSWMPKSSSSMKAVHEGADACTIMHTGDNGKVNSWLTRHLFTRVIRVGLRRLGSIIHFYLGRTTRMCTCSGGCHTVNPPFHRVPRPKFSLFFFSFFFFKKWGGGGGGGYF